jgi:hypothetical protein
MTMKNDKKIGILPTLKALPLWIFWAPMWESMPISLKYFLNDNKIIDKDNDKVNAVKIDIIIKLSFYLNNELYVIDLII